MKGRDIPSGWRESKLQVFPGFRLLEPIERCADCGQPSESFRAEHEAHLCDGCADDRDDCAEAQDAWDAHHGKGGAE